MIKPLKKKHTLASLLLLFPLLGILSSCNPTEVTGNGVRSNVISNNDGTLDNKAYVYSESPYILAGPGYGPYNVDMGDFISSAEVITTNSRLTGNCSMMFYGFTVNLSECIHSLSSASTSNQPLPRNADRTFIFDTNSPEFYQTNTLYLISKATNTFFKKLNFAYEQIQSQPYTIPKSIPAYLMNTKLFWFKGVVNADSRYFKNDFLTSYSQCELEGNALFDSVGPSLCFGSFKDFPGMHIVQDPSVIYHELGHAYVSILLNMRNGTNSTTYHPFRSALNSFGYNEALSINEGIADYYSYVMNQREHFGEFALGKIYKASRPLSEGDAAHISALSETSEGRLSYPQYLLYDSNDPSTPVEDVHLAGQIVSHYLVALTKALKTDCGLTSEADGGHDKATSLTMLVLAETLSELGDLNARGIDNFSSPITGTNFFNNLDDQGSYVWTHSVNPVNYRRFFQSFSKNIYKYISSGSCMAFDKNKSEQLLDDYGLLLFKTYNNNGNSTKDRSITYQSVLPYLSAQALTPVSENNRRKSVLVSKQLLAQAEPTQTNADRASYYLIDNGAKMKTLLSSLLYKGLALPLTKNNAGTEYNNANLRISPGEVVAVIPNLVNNSNTTMAGVQLLASDWDHVHITDQSSGNFKPCVVDGVTTVDQGGEASNTCLSTESTYKRLIKDTTTSPQVYPANAAAPVCLVQLDEGTSSRWVSQNEFRKKQGLSLLDKDCLGYSSSSSTDQDFSFTPHECLVRFLPGVNDANFSKIDPQKTYYETVLKDRNAEDRIFNAGNLLIMEVNKWIPPGTKFRCRLRARFSNCSDCFNDTTNSSDDFIDADYNGSKPYKIINFDFTVND